jgi:uncharacterized membrane protein YedE/YeeE
MGSKFSFCDALPGFWLVQKQKKPIFNKSFDLPKSKDLDFRLIFGAGVFGIGWGIGGLCPGPALTSITFFDIGIYIFVVSMLFGMLITKKIVK